MSDDESSDGMEELRELMAEYGAQAGSVKNPEQKSESIKKEKPAYVEVPMEKVLFGDKATFLSNLSKSVGHKRTKKVTESDDEKDQEEDEEGSTKRLKAAWSDSDDEDIQVGDVRKETRHTGSLKHIRKDKSYKEHLEARFQRTIAQPKWASLEERKTKENGSDDSDEEEPLLKTVGFIDHKAKLRGLLPKSLHYKKLRDVNRDSGYSEGYGCTVKFHPTSTVAMVAGDNCANLYAIDGVRNEKLHTIQFPNHPIKCARITPCGTKAYFGGIRNYYYAYDLLEAKQTKLYTPNRQRFMSLFEVSPCGKYIAMQGKHGALHLVTTNTNELLHTFKQEGSLRDLRFTADSQRILCAGASCNVNVMSIRQKCIEHIFMDDGCILGRSIELSPNERMLATGSEEGVVNIYDYESIYKSKMPQPVKRFMHLRSSVTNIKFNHTSELLAMSTRYYKNGVKMAHFPSATVYPRFPAPTDFVGSVTSMEFSPNSKFVAFGTKNRKVPLFRLKYFKNY